MHGQTGKEINSGQNKLEENLLGKIQHWTEYEK